MFQPVINLKFEPTPQISFSVCYQSQSLTVIDFKTHRIFGRWQLRERSVVFQKIQMPRLCPILNANIAIKPPLFLEMIFYDRKWVFLIIKEGKNFKSEVLPCFLSWYPANESEHWGRRCNFCIQGQCISSSFYFNSALVSNAHCSTRSSVLTLISPGDAAGEEQ